MLLELYFESVFFFFPNSSTNRVYYSKIKLTKLYLIQSKWTNLFLQ